MAYPTLALHLLISAPGDIPVEDPAVIRKTISQWNLTFGRVVGLDSAALTVLPLSWTSTPSRSSANVRSHSQGADRGRGRPGRRALLRPARDLPGCRRPTTRRSRRCC